MTDDQWKALLYALSKGKCLVFLGAGASTAPINGQTRPLTEWLALHLAEQLRLAGHPLEPSEIQSLLYVATEYQQFKSGGLLLKVVDEFYQNHSRQTNELLEILAELPIPLFINTAPDRALERAFRSQYRDCRTAFYSFKKEKDKDSPVAQLPDPTPDCPLIYNLFGSVADTSSLVLTERDRILFIQDIIQNNKSIPNAILKEISSDKIILFFGFDFEQWHLRILPQALFNPEKLENAVLVPNGQQNLAPGTMIFYKKQYKMDFMPLDATEFARQLVQRWRQYETATPSAPVAVAEPQVPLEVFYLYDQADEVFKNELDKHLATLRRNNLIRTWDESKLLAGAAVDESVRQHLASANVILLLVSSDFLANDRLYEDQLMLALGRYRQGKALICPIVVRPCAWEGAIFAKMPTILPKKNVALSAWDDLDTACKHIVQHLQIYLENLKEKLS